jgi:hypothetical protein
VLRNGVRLRLVIFFLLAAHFLPGARADDLLFFGNSFTFGASVDGLSAHGGVPEMVAIIARAKGLDVTAYSLTSPGVDWSWHLANPATAEVLAKSWTWMVLQDYSTRPTRMGNVAQFMRDGDTFSDRLARNSPHAGIVLYETWARPPGDFYKTSGGRQFSGPADMMADLHRAYGALGMKLIALNPDRPVRIALVGTAFARCHAEYPAIPLDAADHHHATEEGYYLAALVIYETLYHQTAAGAPTTFFNGVVKISDEEAKELQRVADEVSGKG